MDNKQIVKYVSYGVAVIALVSLIGTAALQVIALVGVYAVNKFYVNAA